MAVLGFLFIEVAIIDFARMLFNYDLTGVSWSPIVAGAIGSWLIGKGEATEET